MDIGFYYTFHILVVGIHIVGFKTCMEFIHIFHDYPLTKLNLFWILILEKNNDG